MKHNIGKTGKTIRIIIGLIAVYLGYTVSPWFYIIAVLAFIVAAISYCPIIPLIDACKKKQP